MSHERVLITGGTGFLGSHIISQLLEKGYKVRASVRSEKKLRTIFPSVSVDRLEAFEVPDLEADHSKAFKDISALLHLASPSFLSGASNEDVLKGAFNGAVSIVEGAIKAGIKKVVVTGTAASVLEPDFSNGFANKLIGPESWGSVKTYDQIDTSPTGPGPMFTYQAAKTAAEYRIWQLADEHPDVDITTILPSVVLGPFAPNFSDTLSSSPGSLGTNGFVQALLDTPNRQYPSNPMGWVVDVRDVSHAHILALSAPPLPNKQRKRLIISNKSFTWAEIVKVLKAKYPEAVGKRLPADDAPVAAQLVAPVDTTLANKAVGFGGYKPIEETYLETFQAVLEWERRFKA